MFKSSDLNAFLPRNSKFHGHFCAKRLFPSGSLGIQMFVRPVSGVRKKGDFCEGYKRLGQGHIRLDNFSEVKSRFWKKTFTNWDLRIGIQLFGPPFWSTFFHFFAKTYKNVPQYTHAGNDQNDRKLELRATCPAGCYLVSHSNVLRKFWRISLWSELTAQRKNEMSFGENGDSWSEMSLCPGNGLRMIWKVPELL